MIKVSHEMPLELLKNGTEKRYNDYFYALCHLFKNNPQYFDYTVEQLQNGREVILDNSAYELQGQPYEMDQFAAWITKLNDAGGMNGSLTYIIPDTFDDMKKTIEVAHEFLDKYKRLDGDPMVVVQGNSIHELVHAFKVFNDHDRISKIGINFMSKAYTTYCSLVPALKDLDIWEQRSCGRKMLIEMLYHEGQLGLTPIHLLGASRPDEFEYYTVEHPKLSKYIDSLDTSAPVISGMFGDRYCRPHGLRLPKRAEKLAEHLDDPISDTQQNLIEYNMQLFRRYNNL